MRMMLISIYDVEADNRGNSGGGEGCGGHASKKGRDGTPF